MPKKSPIETSQVVELYNLGMKRSDMSKKLGVSMYCIGYHISRARKMGLISEEAHLPIHYYTIPSDKIDEMVALYKRGYTKRVIARKVGVSYITVTKYLDEKGVASPSKHRHYSDEFIKEIADAYNYGCTRYDLALRFNLKESQLNHILKRAQNMNLIKDFRGRTTQWHEVGELINQGYTVSNIAKELEISSTAVRYAATVAVEQGLVSPDTYESCRYSRVNK